MIIALVPAVNNYDLLNKRLWQVNGWRSGLIDKAGLAFPAFLSGQAGIFLVQERPSPEMSS